MQNNNIIIPLNADDLGPYGCPFIVHEDGSITIQRIPKPVPIVTFRRQEVTFDPATMRFRQDGVGDNILQHADILFSTEKNLYIDAAAGPARTGQAVRMSSLEVFLSSTVIPYGQKGCGAFIKEGKSDAVAETIKHYRSHSPDTRVPRLMYCLNNVFCDDLARCYLWVSAKNRLVCVNPGDTFKGSTWIKVGSRTNIGYPVTDSQNHKQAWYRLAFIAGWPDEYKRLFIQRCDTDIHHIDGCNPNCCLEHNLAVTNPCEHRNKHYSHDVDTNLFRTINTFAIPQEQVRGCRDRDPAGPSTAPAAPPSPASPQGQLPLSAPPAGRPRLMIFDKKIPQPPPAPQQSPSASRPARPSPPKTPLAAMPGAAAPRPAPCPSLASPAAKRLCTDTDQDRLDAEAQARLLAREQERRREEEEWLRLFRLPDMAVKQPQAEVWEEDKEVEEEEEEEKEEKRMAEEWRRLEEERRELAEMRRSVKESQRQIREELERLEACRREERQRVEEERQRLKAERRCLEEEKRQMRQQERLRRERELRRYLAEQEVRCARESAKPEAPPPQTRPLGGTRRDQEQQRERPLRLVRHGSDTNRLGNLRLVMDDNDDDDDGAFFRMETQINKPNVIVIGDDEPSSESFFPLTQQPVMPDI